MSTPHHPGMIVAPQVSYLLSPSRPEDYWRLLLWLLWCPQAVHQWTIQHPQPHLRVTLRTMVGIITVVLSSMLAVGLGVWLSLAFSTQLSPFERFLVVAIALFMSLFIGSILLVLDTQASKPVLLIVLFAGAPLVLIITLLCLLQQKLEGIPLLEMMLAQFVLGCSLGFFYSSVAAFVNHGLPYLRIVAWLGGVVSALSMAGQAFFIPEMPPALAGELGVAVSILAAGACCYVGFFAVAVRLEDWLCSWLGGVSGAQPALFGRVTLLPLANLQTALERWVREDWAQALTAAVDLWNYTRQRRIVARVFYIDWLEKQKTPCLSLQVKTLLDSTVANWQPHLFLDGGARSSKQLLLAVQEILLGAEPRALLSYAEVNSVNALLASEEYCKEELFREAEQQLQKVVDTSDAGSAITQLLDAVERFLAIRHPLALAELPKTKPGDIERQTGIWPAINQLMEALIYFWLARCCQNSQNQATALKTAGEKLDDLEQWIARATTLTVCENKILSQIVANWRQDLHGGQPVEPLEFKSCPQMQYEPFIYNEPLWRAGLMRDCDKAREALVKALTSEHLQVCEISGPILCGKTSLLMCAIARPSPVGDVQCVRVDLKFLNTRAPALKRVAIALFDALSNGHRSVVWTEEKLNNEPLRVLEELIREICNPEEGGEGKRLIIVLDNVDTIEDILTLHYDLYKFLQFLFHLCESIPSLGVVLICTLDHGHNYENFRSSITRLANPITVTLFNPANNTVIAEFLQHPQHGFCHRFTQKAVERVAALTGGQPYLVQLLAAGVLKQFRDNYRYVAGGALPAGQARFYDPLFNEMDVEDAARSPFVMQGLRYYWHRLEQHFAREWSDIERILNEYQSNWNAKLRPVIVAARFPKTPITVDTSYVADLMDRLAKQGVLESDHAGQYGLRIKLLNYPK